MKIFLICSKKFYGLIPPIKEELENMGAYNHTTKLLWSSRNRSAIKRYRKSC